MVKKNKKIPSISSNEGTENQISSTFLTLGFFCVHQMRSHFEVDFLTKILVTLEPYITKLSYYLFQLVSPPMIYPCHFMLMINKLPLHSSLKEIFQLSLTKNQ